MDVEVAEERGIEPPALVFFPNRVEVTLGTSAMIEVFALEVDSLGGAYVQVEYDDSRLTLTSVQTGELLQGTNEPLFLWEDDGAGTLEIYTFYLGADSTSVSGTGNLAQLVFNTKAPGETILRYGSACELVNSDDVPIDIKGFGEGVIDAR